MSKSKGKNKRKGQRYTPKLEALIEADRKAMFEQAFDVASDQVWDYLLDDLHGPTETWDCEHGFTFPVCRANAVISAMAAVFGHSGVWCEHKVAAAWTARDTVADIIESAISPGLCDEHYAEHVNETMMAIVNAVFDAIGNSPHIHPRVAS